MIARPPGQLPNPPLEKPYSTARLNPLMRALVSIHDVMPDTLERVADLLDWLAKRGVPPVTLLVVPGLNWKTTQLNQLREWADTGHELAAHGWVHKTRPRRLYHRAHAALISRNVAEHLDLNSPGILQLLHRAREWFPSQALPTPNIYVPPAWALGPIQRPELQQAPYKQIETTSGRYHIDGTTDPGSIRFEKLPLTGYEADTPARAGFLRCWNRLQTRLAREKDKPLRLSIHPNDRQLRLHDQLAAQLDAVDRFEPYENALP